MSDKQTRVCTWLTGARCKHRSFLDFPEDVRNKIYRHVGFTRYDEIQYDGAPEPQATLDKSQQGEQQNQSAHDNLEKDDEESEYDTDEESEYDSDEDPAEIEDRKLARLLRDPEVKGSVFGKISLMLCCKTMYHEILCMTYEHYDFTITHSPGAIRRMTPDSTALLASLTVELHLADGGQIPDHPAPDSLVNVPGPVGDQLQLSSPRTPQLLMGWLDALDHLGRHLTPGTLRLSFTCDVDSFALASAMVSPLLGLPLLQQCWLRLSALPNPDITRLLRCISRKCTGKFSLDECSFRYTELPRELHLLIMGYTDLVSPFEEIHWNPREGYHLRWSYNSGTHSDRLENNFDRAGWEKHDCWARTEEKCFCSRYHAAYSDECDCWQPPTNLFLVGKAFRRDAVEVFFRSNRFSILPFFPPRDHIGDKLVQDLSQPLPLRHFLRTTVPSIGLLHLRSLELVYGPMRMNDSLYAQLPGFYNRLADEAEFMIDHLRLDRLTLVLHMADLCPDSELVNTRDTIPDEVLKRVDKLYENVGRRLSKLKGLKCFYAFLAEPLRWQILIASGGLDVQDLIDDLKSAKEGDMERLVMGNDYKAEDHGKDEYIQSAWYCKNDGWDMD
ncbi:hypothetical protein KVT40_003683 [Elsinoe batatas]|uniref:Uncharacterized protein n=1 Tax=Elsinoe batatas TaxID=2601811 RepID=A0A8K0PD94_9PEZI|nr:hypothetical protein KVT40_003683 [Elsinoe batatas]